MNLDPRTVVILTVLSTLIMSIGLFAMARGYLAEIRGVTRWASGTLLQSAGWILLALIGVIPLYISELGSPLIMLAMALYFHALTAFKEYKANVNWVYVLVIFNFLFLYYFLLVTPNVAVRIAIASATAAILMFSSARVLLFVNATKRPFSHTMTGLLFAACSIILLVRTYYYLFINTAPEQSTFQQNIIQDIAFLTFFIAAVLSPFTFVLMCNERYTSNALLRTKEMAEKNNQLEEANQVKGQFLATMSHELRTPLNGVIGFLNQLGKTKLDDQQKDFLHTIDLSARMLLNVINDVLDYSKIEAGKLSIENIEIDLREFFDNTISMFSANAEDKGLDLVCVIDHQIPNLVSGDPLRLTQILSNLLGNAIKFTEMGEVLLEASLLSQTDSSVSLQITVTDTGIGISQQSLERLFQPFVQADASTTRKHGGTGLGLIIARRLVDMMGGSIEVESEMWRGTRFTIKLELKKLLVSEKNQIKPNWSHLNLLVVTPSMNVARSISENLKFTGIASKIANSGFGALSLYKEADAKANAFDAVIFDHAIEDVTPFEFAGYLKVGKSTKQIPLLLLGSLSFCPTTDEMNQNGFRACFYKPLKGSELNQKLINLFVSNQTNEQVRAIPAAGHRAENYLKPLAGKRVLIVDDNHINRKLVQLLIAELGGEFSLAENGIQAVDACSRKEYDLILMDVNMPVMDGMEATKRIRALESTSRRTPIFALTANALPGDKERFLLSGMDDYLSKPINEHTLFNLLSKWCPRENRSVESDNVSAVEISPNETMPALDPKMGIQLSFGDPDTWHMVLGMMLDELENYSSKFVEFENNTEQLTYWSHKLAGTTCYCGTPALFHAAKQLEQNCINGDAQKIECSLVELMKQITLMIKLDGDGKLRRSEVVVYLD